MKLNADQKLEHYTTRVKSGAAWLDRVRPGWANQINLATFDFRRNCVLIQLFDPEGAWQSSLKAAFPELTAYDKRAVEATRLGFCADAWIVNYNNDDNDILEQLWREEIRTRLRSAQPVVQDTDELEAAVDVLFTNEELELLGFLLTDAKQNLTRAINSTTPPLIERAFKKQRELLDSIESKLA
jgi:hypothetical protein